MIALHDAVAWGGAEQAIRLLTPRGYENTALCSTSCSTTPQPAVAKSPGGLANRARRFEASGAMCFAGAAWANRAAAGNDEARAPDHLVA